MVSDRWGILELLYVRILINLGMDIALMIYMTYHLIQLHHKEVLTIKVGSIREDNCLEGTYV
jgi:hypothetical protein